jgi:hypothetical protein
MRAFSAADSVSLAIQRTREFLFSSFSWGTYLKLGLIAIITEGSWSSLRSSSNGGSHRSGQGGPMISSPFHIPAAWIAASVAAVLLGIVVSLFVLYLITRLRFAFFHCLIHKTKEIRPGWHLYREPATRFFWLNVVVGFCFVALVGLLSLPFVAGFWRLFREIRRAGHPDIGMVLSLVLPLIPIIMVLVLVGLVTDLVLRDLMMPHYALDNATAREAWTEVWASMKAEHRQFLAYILLRVVLPTIAMVALFMVLLIPGAILAGAFGAIEYGVHSAFANSTGGAAVAGSMLQVFFGLVALVFMALAGICLGAPLSTGIREYALMFYGGRYPVLGNILDPPAAQLPPLPSASVVA